MISHLLAGRQATRTKVRRWLSTTMGHDMCSFHKLVAACLLLVHTLLSCLRLSGALTRQSLASTAMRQSYLYLFHSYS